MFEALERVTRKRIDADNATHAGRYICPECHKPVDLRSGGVISAYFAHAKGVSNEECALFAAQLHSGSHSIHSADDTSQPEMALKLKLVANKKGYSWGLEIDVPTLRADDGSISVDVGGRISEIRLDSNSSAYRTVTAEPTSEPYKIVATNPPTGRFSAIERLCLGLNGSGGTVFGDIQNPGKRSEKRAWELQRERTYAFVWPEAMACEFPRDLEAVLLEQRQGWAAALLEVPFKTTPEVEAWLEQFTGLKIAPASPAIIPAWPPLFRPLTARVVDTLAMPSVFVYVDLCGEKEPLALFAKNHESPKVAQGDSIEAPFFKISPEGSSAVHLMCRKAAGVELDIDFSLLGFPLTTTNFVRLTGRQEDGTICRVDLHDNAANDWLKRVRAGEIEFLSLSFPHGVAGRIACGNISSWKKIIAVRDLGVGTISIESPMKQPSEIAATIATWMRDKTLDVLFDFEGFGWAKLSATQVVRDFGGDVLSPKLVRGVRFYLLQFPGSGQLPKNWEGLPPRELTTAFRSIRPKLDAVIHHRFLVAQLKKFAQTEQEREFNQ